MKKAILSLSLVSLLFVNGIVFAQSSQTQVSLPTPVTLPDNGFAYWLKTTGEDLTLAFTFNDTAKAQYETQLAEKRLAEINAEIQKGDIQYAAKAQARHDQEVADIESIADRQAPDNHGQAVKAYIQQLLADHEEHIGQLVSIFASNNTSMNTTHTQQSTAFQNLQSNTQNIRQSHGDYASPNPNMHIPFGRQ